MIPPMLNHQGVLWLNIEMHEVGWRPADDTSNDEASNDISSS